MSIRLLAITPPTDPVDPAVVDVWMRAGARAEHLVVVLREPGRSPAALVAPEHRLALLRQHCRARAIRCVVACDAADLESAVALVRADLVDGVHLRGDPGVACLRRARDGIGSAVLGRACHGAPASGHALVDYSCVAPIFSPRTTTPGHPKVAVGPQCLHAWSAAPRAWPIALGGVTAHTAGACLAAGARGLASIRGFFGPAPSVAEDVAAFVRALEQASVPDEARTRER